MKRFTWFLSSIILLSGLNSFAANAITRETVADAEKIIGLHFNDEKRDMLLGGLNARLSDYETIRRTKIPYGTPPAILFNPLPVGFKMPTQRKEPKFSAAP